MSTPLRTLVKIRYGGTLQKFAISFNTLLSWLPTDARVSSASHQRPQLTGLPAQGVSNRHTRQRKVSRSAAPSPAALRKALKISGGE